MGVSVVICCYNSAARLPETLRHMAAQRVPAHVPWEVIVVNNASKDDTAAVARQAWAAGGGTAPFRVVDEPTPGLSHARERGFDTARYDFVLFCDDDNWLNDDYVAIGYDVLRANPQIGALGGHGEAVCEVPPPHWFDNIGFMVFAMSPQAVHSGEVHDSRGMVYGAGAFIRKSYYTHLKDNGFQSRLTDRKGKEISSGGDDELCYALRLAGYKIWYDERLYFRHFIPKERLEWDYVKRFFQGSAKATTVLEPFSDVLKNGDDRPPRRYTSLKKSVAFLLREGLPYYVKSKIAVTLNKSARASLQQRLEFYRKLMIAKQWLLHYREYDKNLLALNEFKVRLRKSKKR